VVGGEEDNWWRRVRGGGREGERGRKEEGVNGGGEVMEREMKGGEELKYEEEGERYGGAGRKVWRGAGEGEG